ncbi:ATP-binding protein [Ideonella sp. DXS29W]|uniref:histidine kinase n=1 Tax=Ideonella lacteola TaxID=2984193 RepID=A0ABU9BNW0_9BURK
MNRGSASPPQGWRRFDTLTLRLFVLMWVVLVGAHAAAHWLAVPPPPGAASGPPAPMEPFPSLPPSPLWDRGGPPDPARQPAPPEAGRNAMGPSPGPGRVPPGPSMWLDYGVRLLVIALGAALCARWVAGPMRRLASAAEQLAQGLQPGQRPPMLDERRGSREVRATAHVFNDMAQQLQAQFDARGLQMAAVSHDLRTPLTRLRMRLEGIDHPATSAAIADIHEMNALIDSSLAVLREQRDAAPPDAVDLLALAQAAVDDLAGQGHQVTMGESQAVRARAHPVALRRIVDNLLNNALQHGGSARVTVRPADSGSGERGVVLWVDDEGPGIPPEQIDQVMQPWVSLSPDHGTRQGLGLGLAIARDLAERDGGRLSLANRTERGLRATLWLPAA